MPLSPGTRLGNYEIRSELGSGGTGEVYKAKDLKLGRDVAIKVLRKDLAAPDRLQRFEQEARAASALNHPNIVTIHEIGEHEGTPYIAMEYVEGLTLRTMLAKGPLSSDQLPRYVTQMAEGLAKAHQAGIVHRDLKPENVVISEDGYVKILDFGLAKLMPSRIDSDMQTMDKVVTEAGVVVGTVPYMSPEQAAGGSVDYRSDQFSLGSILFEMATGRLAFKRETAAETLTAIIREEPDPIALVNPKVSAGTARVINRCLAKDPNDRYDSTWDIAKDIHWEDLAKPEPSSRRDPLATVGAVGILAIVLVMIFGLFASDIRNWVAGGSQVPKIESIAVLPLENLSGDPEQEYFTDGMTEALIADLAKISALRVISRQSVMRFKGSEAPLTEIVEALDVDAVVEGTVLRVGDQVRITAALVGGSTEQHIWTESYDRELSNVLALLGEMAQVIADEIEVAITPDQRERIASATTLSPEIQEVYLKARFFMNRLTVADLRKAAELYSEAIDRDPVFAQAYSGLALSELALGVFGAAPFETMASRSRANASRALELDDGLAEAHSGLALVELYYDWNWKNAESRLRRALALNPNDAFARHAWADYLLITSEVDESVRQLELARQMDPLSPLVIGPLVGHLVFARRYEKAVDEGRKLLQLYPDNRAVRSVVATALWHQGSYEESLAGHRETRGIESPVVDAMETAYASFGPRAAMAAAGDILAARPGVSPLHVASRYAAAGQADAALEWLEKALATRTPQLLHLRVDPEFDPIRDDLRFQDLLRRMNFPR